MCGSRLQNFFKCDLSCEKFAHPCPKRSNESVNPIQIGIKYIYSYDVSNFLYWLREYLLPYDCSRVACRLPQVGLRHVKLVSFKMPNTDLALSLTIPGLKLRMRAFSVVRKLTFLSVILSNHCKLIIPSLSQIKSIKFGILRS